jgi:XRE family aerobic/anaerobic benzoate catabolism transcriptional regulator
MGENLSAQNPEIQGLLRRLGERLRGAREKAGLSVVELARRAGLSRRTLTEIEAARTNPTLVSLAALAQAAGAELHELLAPDAGHRRHGRIALVGLRGAGKSTVGRRLALLREVPFVELDRRVEEQAGLSLGAIFELHGAAWFQKVQREALERVLAEGENLVLATGGSIVADEATFARLRQTCHTVWLRARPEDHLARVAAQGDLRPMRGRPRALEELAGILAAREAAYARCELAIDTSARTAESVVQELLRRFGEPVAEVPAQENRMESE